MVSLLEIYNIKEPTLTEKRLDHISHYKGQDPETGKHTWDIEYKTDLNSTYKEIDEAVKRLEELVSQRDNDTEANGLVVLARTLRNRFARYKNK
tara:strand:- start:882 stop:1163 length:282 start_codon:yes stop_codon:yes gene_type:complete